MDDTPQLVRPNSDDQNLGGLAAPQPDEPISIFPEPMPPEEHDTSSVVRKAVLSTSLVVLLLVGFVWYDPLNLFQFRVDISQDQAAGITVINATCVAGPQIKLSWNTPSNTSPVTLQRRNDKDKEELNIFFESGTGNYSYTDLDIKYGMTYRYSINISPGVSDDISITPTLANCR